MSSSKQMAVENTSAQQTLHQEARNVAKQLLAKLAIVDANAIVDAIQLDGNADGPHMPSPLYVTEALTGVNIGIATLLHLIGELRLDSIPPPSTIRVNSEHSTNMTHSHFTHEFDGRRYHEAQDVLQAGTAARDPNLQFNTIFVGHWVTNDGRALIFYPNARDTPADIMAAVGFAKDKIEPLIKLANSTEASDRVRFCKAFAQQIGTWDSKGLQNQLTKVRVGTVGVPLTQAEFLESPHGQIASKWPRPLLFVKSPSPERPLSSGVADLFPRTPFSRIRDSKKSGVLSGVRIVEFTRVVAGPVAGLALGPFGPDTLRISNPGLQDQFLLSVPMNMNKRLIEVDARSPSGLNLLQNLILEADVVMENNALGAMDRLGLGADDVIKMIAEKRPEKGIIYSRSNAYGFEGPFAPAPGYEHVAQAMSGLTMEQGIDSPYEPAPPEGTSIPTLIPVNALDCFTGHNLALGTLAGLYRRAIEGGSWLVQGSLLQSAMFIQTLPRHDRATVKRLWKRYPAWPLEFDGATLKGTMSHYFRFMSDYLRDGTPSSHASEMYIEFTTTPYGVPVRTLSSPIKLSGTRTGPRFAPRPFAYDGKGQASWLADPDECDVVDLGGGKYRWVGADKAKL